MPSRAGVCPTYKTERQKRGQCRAVLIGASLFLALAAFRSVAQSPGNSANQSDQLLTHLNAVIDWYKHLTTEAPPAQQPSDAVYSTNAENFAEQVVRLAFQSARAQAVLLSPPQQGNSSASGQNNTTGTSAQKYQQSEAQITQRIADDEAQIKQLKSKPSRAGKSTEQQIEALEGKLALDRATLAAVQQMERFVEESSAGGTGLERNINELARSVPEIFNMIGTKAAALPSTAKPQSNTSSGLFGQLVALYREILSIRTIQQRLDENDNIQKIANSVRAPLHDKLRNTLQQGTALGQQNNVSKEQYDALTQQFKQLSAALLPLNEEIMVLDQSRTNLVNWRSSHATESRTLLLSIIMRVAVILIAIGIIFAIAEAWRRLTFRYVREPRRRRQFLVLRRFVMGFFICTILVLGFVSEFSSLATFAGFVTAGIAVGLQTVLLSVAAYFFVVGRYGIRIGDRITIAGVTGDVVDLGLVRFYVMEFAASGAELFPTGRIVVFSNSVLFQPTTPLYKQLPGTHYTWHELVVPLANGADHESLQRTVNDAVHSVYQEYSRQAEWQKAFNYNMEITLKPPVPEQHLQFSDTGAEIVIRYPVDLHRAPEIDDKIVRALMDAVAKNGNTAGIAGTPKLRNPVKV